MGKIRKIVWGSFKSLSKNNQGLHRREGNPSSGKRSCRNPHLEKDKKKKKRTFKEQREGLILLIFFQRTI